MSRIIVADTGPLIALALVDLLPALSEMFSKVYIPHAVLAEAIHDAAKPGAKAITTALAQGWIIEKAVSLEPLFEALVELLDRGEAEALALAKQLDAVALIDERRGRKVAAKQGIRITGSSAIFIKAKLAGVIDEVAPLIDKLAMHGYRMSDDLKRDVLNKAGE